MRVMQVLAVLVCVAGGIMTADSSVIGPPGGDAVAARENGQAAGFVIGTVIGPLLLSALVLGWSRRTRRYIPFLAVGLFFFGAVGRAGAGREETDRELSRTRGMVNAFADSVGRDSGDVTSSSPPESQTARLLWVMNRALAEIPAHKAEVARRHGIATDDPPAAWGTARYVANATSYPEVEQHWLGYRAFLADFRDGFPDWVEARVTAHAHDAGLGSRVARKYAERVRHRAGSMQSESNAWADSTAAAALAYHRFLVSVDARVSYDARRDLAMFDRNADLERANVLQARIQSAARMVTRAQEVARRRTMGQLDSLGVKLK